MDIEFTAHNVRLADGTSTRPGVSTTLDAHPWFMAARRVIETVFPGERSHLRLADLGCLEGGFSVEFARLGLQVLGLEVRESNYAACLHVKERTRLANLEFAHDNAWNVARYGRFDAVFCSGLLYHLDEPRRFLQLLSSVTDKLLLLHTHFSTEHANSQFALSPLSEHEGVPGRWFTEFPSEESFRARESARWASWDNRRSFWIRREHLLQTIQDAGWDLVLEQYDSLGDDIAGGLTDGYYKSNDRSMFIGIKTGARPTPRS